MHASRGPAAAAREDMLGLSERLGRALQGLPEELHAVRRRQLHFVTSPLPALRGTSWLPRLLGSWRSPRKILHVQTSEGVAPLRTLPRGDEPECSLVYVLTHPTAQRAPAGP